MFYRFIEKYWPKKWVATALVVATILYLTLVPKPLPDDMPNFPGLDNLVHAIMFGGLAGTAIFDYSRHGKRFEPFSSRSAWVICGASFLFGIAIEFAQDAMGMGRGGDIWDALSDGVGCVVAYYIVKYIFSKK